MSSLVVQLFSQPLLHRIAALVPRHGGYSAGQAPQQNEQQSFIAQDRLVGGVTAAILAELEVSHYTTFELNARLQGSTS